VETADSHTQRFGNRREIAGAGADMIAAGGHFTRGMVYARNIPGDFARHNR
jgi:hypothetical protein